MDDVSPNEVDIFLILILFCLYLQKQNREKVSETELIQRLNKGDKEAFTSLYYLYCDKVHNFCRLYLTASSVAEEVVQEVFIKLWEVRGCINENENLAGFLFIITRNLIFDNSRKGINEDFYKMSVLAAYEEAYDIEGELDAQDMRRYVDRLIDELPPRQKEVFQLSRSENLSYKEIAERLDITPKTVERHINEALKYLRKNLYFLTIFLST